GLTASRERFSLRRALVVSQVALSLVLLVGALLFVSTLRNLLNLDPGFRPDGLLQVTLDFSSIKLPKTRRVPYRKELLERIVAVPGIEAATETSIIPLTGNWWNEIVLRDRERAGQTNCSRITPGYFRTVQMDLKAGRDFDERDTATSQKVAIVNEA